MSNIVFALPRHPYASYADLYTLIDLSGFQKCYIDEIDPQSDNAYIITILNGEVPEGGYPEARAKIVLWDNEWHLDGVPQLPGVEYWAADKWYAERIGAQYVPMGSHVGLRMDADSTSPEHYDVAYLGYMIPRRERIYVEFKQAGVKASPPHAWGEERHRILSNSTTYLHVHQHDNVPTIAPLRMVVAAAYSLPVISETCNDASAFRGYMLQLAYRYIAETIPHALQDNWLADSGARLHHYLCQHWTFRRSVEYAL